MPFAKSLSEMQRSTQRGHGAGSTKEKYPLNTSHKKNFIYSVPQITILAENIRLLFAAIWSFSMTGCLPKLCVFCIRPGIKESYSTESLVGKTLLAITNLSPRKMMGIESEGMLLSAICDYDGEEMLNLVMLNKNLPAGAKIY